MLSRLALEALYGSGSGQLRVGDDDRVIACSWSHNHFQSSGECNTSSPHCRSWLSVHSTPTLLSRCSISVILLPGGEEWSSS